MSMLTMSFLQLFRTYRSPLNSARTPSLPFLRATPVALAPYFCCRRRTYPSVDDNSATYNIRKSTILVAPYDVYPRGGNAVANRLYFL